MMWLRLMMSGKECVWSIRTLDHMMSWLSNICISLSMPLHCKKKKQRWIAGSVNTQGILIMLISVVSPVLIQTRVILVEAWEMITWSHLIICFPISVPVVRIIILGSQKGTRTWQCVSGYIQHFVIGWTVVYMRFFRMSVVFIWTIFVRKMCFRVTRW